MPLGQKQKAFTLCIEKLITKAYELGYSLTFGEAYRTDEQAEINAMGSYKRTILCTKISTDFPALSVAIANNAKGGGIAHSVHMVRLAVDFNLFLPDGTFATHSEDYKTLGDYWKTLDPDARWGGDFGDGNHFSFEDNGIK